MHAEKTPFEPAMILLPGTICNGWLVVEERAHALHGDSG
jgi:hypothetical protein